MAMFTKETPISLATLDDGAIIAQADHELQQIWNNVMDPNTSPAARTLTITVKIKPDAKRREICAITSSVVKRMAPLVPVETSALVGMGRQGAEASELVSAQMPLPLQGDNVTPLSAGKQGGE